jgi:hypothetical protein
MPADLTLAMRSPLLVNGNFGVPSPRAPGSGFQQPGVSREAAEEMSVQMLANRINAVADQLQTALAKLGGSEAPSQQLDDPAAQRALDFLAVGIPPPEPVSMSTASIQSNLQRIFGIFSGVGPKPTGTKQCMSMAHFRKMVRAAQLTSERCNDVDVELIFQQVVRSRGGRMALKDLIKGLALVALRLHPAQRTQSAAFHHMLTDQLLPWMLQLQHQLVSSGVMAPV